MAHRLRFGEGYRFDMGLRFGQLVPDQKPDLKGRNHMASTVYFIPSNRADRRAWLLNLKGGIDTYGPVLGLSPEDITSVKTTCDAQIAFIDKVTEAETKLQAAQEAETNGEAINLGAIKEEVANWKTRSGYTSEAGAGLKIVSAQKEFSADVWKCEFTVKILHGEIRIDWKKKGVQAVHIYSRLNGQTVWVLLATDTNSPYIDGRPLAQPGVAETREYMIRGLMNDAEIGVDSDVQSVTWKGQ